MTTALLVGAGAVGARAGRQLLDTSGIDHVLLADRDRERADRVAGLLGPSTTAVDVTDGLPADVGVVAGAVDDPGVVPVARAAAAAGVPGAFVADTHDTITALLGLDDAARAASSTVAVGCALAPGLVEVLAGHAAAVLDRADELHVARVGVSGRACADAVQRARREPTLEWHDGGWRADRRLGAQLVWFPEPVGVRPCESVAMGVGLLRDAVPDVRHATVRLGESMVRGALGALVGRRKIDDGWAAVRVEVWGWRGDARESVVYGVVADPAVATGTVLAVTAARLAGLLPDVHLVHDRRGASGLGSLVEPASFLAELARRGVKAATFEGVAI